MNMFQNNLKKDNFSVFESNNTSIPPTSLNSFLKIDPKFPGVVLTGFKDQFKNKYVYFIFLIMNMEFIVVYWFYFKYKFKL